MTKNKKVSLSLYLLGAFFIIGMTFLILKYEVPSLLRWQGEFLSRTFFILMLCFTMCLIRVVIGPKASDRAISMNAMGILIVGFCAVLSIATGRDWYLDIAIAWALQSFVGALAIAKYLEGRGFDD